ncbi:MAG: hypothetical protein IJF10_01120 [Clostridia bacterium]|nr:hypothetical protein [Clostridia bacterium]
MEKHKSCCFVGHRSVPHTPQLKSKLQELVQYLVASCNVQTFLFGSKSAFNDLCYQVVTEAKKAHPHIQRVAYTCKSESCTLQSNVEQSQAIYKRFDTSVAFPFVVEQEVEHPSKHVAGKACYVQRNMAMVDASDFCVFYFCKGYVVAQGKETPAKSGTAIAHDYAVKRGKVVFNVAQN